ncbi:DNA/RNA polymerases superfamily protein [Cucumis melo var. makuwa]|uniref:DNA/RNA polymerases superfamily protein n=1 Tax=Cucumis melo var. makuwa TaxID=1194695 RepID=A0A5D3E050_CUCMM|nr:DNA/RNA polymerases superfamily protein [Cucumis melo var. makuwa]TYK29081.1 DNA/RNA polymerases superfamily protein [Cucumis melo var. makuwa]
MKVDLILFELDELDVILEMYFLTEYHVILDCSNKEVVLRDLKKFEVKFRVDKKVELAGIISVLKARRLMKKGNTAYLEHVVDTQTSKSDPSRVPIVCEYLDVFLEELGGLPLRREVKFTIEFVPRTTPIS